jgi:hypothetical protein
VAAAIEKRTRIFELSHKPAPESLLAALYSLGRYTVVVPLVLDRSSPCTDYPIHFAQMRVPLSPSDSLGEFVFDGHRADIPSLGFPLFANTLGEHLSPKAGKGEE